MAEPERCISCNAIIPEGRQVCPNCLSKGNIEKKEKKKLTKMILKFFKRK